jgi:hypothetical protein
MHLYQYFGTLLGCTMQGMDAFPAYAGAKSLGSVHRYVSRPPNLHHSKPANIPRFMDLDPYQLGYFITQVGLSAASFGVAAADVTAVGMELEKVFGYKCSPPATVIKAQGPELQSICQDSTCPMDMGSNKTTCDNYMSGGKPFVANVTLAMGEGQNASSTSSASGSGTSGAPATGSSTAAASSKAAAGHITGQIGSVLGAAVLAFAL